MIDHCHPSSCSWLSLVICILLPLPLFLARKVAEALATKEKKQEWWAEFWMDGLLLWPISTFSLHRSDTELVTQIRNLEAEIARSVFVHVLDSLTDHYLFNSVTSFANVILFSSIHPFNIHNCVCNVVFSVFVLIFPCMYAFNEEVTPPLSLYECHQ